MTGYLLCSCCRAARDEEGPRCSQCRKLCSVNAAVSCSLLYRSQFRDSMRMQVWMSANVWIN